MATLVSPMPHLGMTSSINSSHELKNTVDYRQAPFLGAEPTPETLITDLVNDIALHFASRAIIADRILCTEGNRDVHGAGSGSASLSFMPRSPFFSKVDSTFHRHIYMWILVYLCKSRDDNQTRCGV